MVINRCDAGIWLFKLSLADQPFQTIVFAVAVFFGVSPVWLVLAAIFAGIFSGRSKEKRGENRE